MQIKYLSHTSARPPGLLRKTGAIIVTTALAAVALMFSAVFFAALLIFVAIGGAYLWWKTRELRKLMRAQMQNFPPPHRTAAANEVFKGEVFEGEAVRVETSRERQ